MVEWVPGEWEKVERGNSGGGSRFSELSFLIGSGAARCACSAYARVKPPA